MDGLVELVDADGRGISKEQVTTSHRHPAMRHRAFSAVLHDGAGSILLQTRAAGKERWPGFVANSTCGHPNSARTLVDDCARRIHEELGCDVEGLVEVGHFEYRAACLRGWLEWEFDHVLVGRVVSELRPNPEEIAEVHWIDHWPVDGLRPLVPWVGQALEIALPHVPHTTDESVSK